MKPDEPTSLWPKGVVPYAMAKSVEHHERKLIASALDEIEQRSRVRFVKRTKEHDRLTFRLEGSPHSAIGRCGGDQTVSLARPLRRGQILHEVLHALGVYHEHTRPGRDDYIELHLDHAIDDGAAALLGAVEPRADVRSYDYGSVMHYPTNAFAKLGRKTIVPRKPLPPGFELGAAEALSIGDVKTLELLYP